MVFGIGAARKQDEPDPKLIERERLLRERIQAFSDSKAGGLPRVFHSPTPQELLAAERGVYAADADVHKLPASLLREEYLALDPAIRKLNLLPSGDEHRRAVDECFPTDRNADGASRVDEGFLRMLDERRRYWSRRYPQVFQFAPDPETGHMVQPSAPIPQPQPQPVAEMKGLSLATRAVGDKFELVVTLGPMSGHSAAAWERELRSQMAHGRCSFEFRTE